MVEFEIRTIEENYAAIGKLVTAHAAVETQLRVLIRALSGLPEAEARKKFHVNANFHKDNYIPEIKRLLADDPASLGEAEACFKHFERLGKKRHNLVHRQSSVFLGGVLNSNIQTSETEEGFESDVFTERELSAMTDDYEAICLRLEAIVHPPLDPEVFEYFKEWKWSPTPSPIAPRRGRRKT